MLTLKQVDLLEKLVGKLNGIYLELGTLARKSPNDGVNIFKLALVNEILKSCNGLLGKQYKPLEGFLLFDPDSLPTNSDVTFIISQYMEAMEKFRADNVFIKLGAWYYQLNDSEEMIRTAAPDKIIRK